MWSSDVYDDNLITCPSDSMTPGSFYRPRPALTRGRVCGKLAGWLLKSQKHNTWSHSQYNNYCNVFKRNIIVVWIYNFATKYNYNTFTFRVRRSIITTRIQRNCIIKLWFNNAPRQQFFIMSIIMRNILVCCFVIENRLIAV